MKYFISFAFSFGIFSLIHSQTTVPFGEVYGTWAKSESPYYITGTIHIPHDSTLIIEPGVRVEFQGSYELKVMGSLLAEGSETDTILFTVNDTTGYFMEDTTLGGWKGIRISDINESNDSTRLAYCRLEYGKAIGTEWPYFSGGALYVSRFDKVSVSHCLFRHNKAFAHDDNLSSGGAVYIEFSNISLTENTFIKNKAERGGAVYFHSSDPVFKKNHFVYNQSALEGGGLSGGGVSNPSFLGDVFRNNMSEERGGGLMIYGPASIYLDQVSVLENSANWAGGMGFVGCDVQISNSSISRNLATSMGGGIASDASTIDVKNTIFEGDSSSNIAGAIHVWQGLLKMQKTSLTGNSAISGGGINADWSQVVVNQSQFNANTAQGGGGLHLFNCHLLMDSCSLDGNTAREYSGAIDYAVDTLVFDSLFACTLLGTQIINNQSGNAAGGMSIQQTHADHPMLDLRIDNCLIADNSAHHVGGFRIFRCTKPLVISNSIIRGNLAEAWTGGVTISHQSQGHVYNCLFYDNHAATVNTGSSAGGLTISILGTKVDVNHCTFVGNSAGRGGGLQAYRGGNTIVSNSIFWENYPEQLALNSVIDSLPCKLTLNYNNIQYGMDSITIVDTVSTLVFGEGNMNEDPVFVNASQADYHLMDTSPAIGAAMDPIEVEGVLYHSPTVDMEGNPRPNPSGSRPDLGAFENIMAWPVGMREYLQTSSKGIEIQTYPNPFRHSITFEFRVLEQGFLTLEIFNLLGEKIEVGTSEIFEPGIHRLIWEPTDPMNHVYFYRIRMESVSNQVFIKTGQILRID